MNVEMIEDALSRIQDRLMVMTTEIRTLGAVLDSELSERAGLHTGTVASTEELNDPALSFLADTDEDYRMLLNAMSSSIEACECSHPVHEGAVGAEAPPPEHNRTGDAPR
jgi:hypothetical protein